MKLQRTPALALAPASTSILVSEGVLGLDWRLGVAVSGAGVTALDFSVGALSVGDHWIFNTYLA